MYISREHLEDESVNFFAFSCFYLWMYGEEVTFRCLSDDPTFYSCLSLFFFIVFWNPGFVKLDGAAILGGEPKAGRTLDLQRPWQPLTYSCGFVSVW